MTSEHGKFAIYGILSAFILASASMPQAHAEPKYSAKVPESVKTPDKVETDRLGTLEFFDGMPSPETVQKVYDNLDLTRGVTAFLDGIPIASMYAMLTGFRDAGVKIGEIGITENLMDARTLILTPNSTTMYVLAQIDLSDGPVVVNAPPGVLGFVNDAASRYVFDIGVAGPDKGKGGKYLVIPPGYKGDIPDGYYVFKSKTYDNWLLLRAFVKDGDLKTPVKMLHENLNLYPLSQADNPPPETFHNLSGKKYNAIHANNFEFYEEINEVIQREPADAFPTELTGTFASIGIKKGKPFKPDARMKKILIEAAAIGNATARALTFNTRKKSAFYVEDRKWTLPFAGGSHEFVDNGERVLDDRTRFHYFASGITPAMASSVVGQGSAYASATMDSNGKYLDGGKTYKVTLPNPVPVNNFWAFTIYSGQHRGFLETDQQSAGVDSNSPDIKPNKDGSYTVWFGPTTPKGHEGNWVQTIPGKSFNVYLRVYGPLEPWFERTWKPGDFELVE
jgi:hypothetical protein